MYLYVEQLVDKSSSFLLFSHFTDYTINLEKTEMIQQVSN